MPTPQFIYDLQMLLPTLVALAGTLYLGQKFWYSQTLKTALGTFICAVIVFALGWFIYPQAPIWVQWLIWPGHVLAGLIFLVALLVKVGLEEWGNPETQDRAIATFGVVVIVVVLCLVVIALPFI